MITTGSEFNLDQTKVRVGNLVQILRSTDDDNPAILIA